MRHQSMMDTIITQTLVSHSIKRKMKYYAHRNGETQIFTVEADSDDKAEELFEKKLGTTDFIFGRKLPHKQPKVSRKEMEAILNKTK